MPGDPLVHLLRAVNRRRLLALVLWAFIIAGCIDATGLVVASTLRWPLSSGQLVLFAITPLLLTLLAMRMQRRMPETLLATARRIDESHGLHDLLSSAWHVRARDVDPATGDALQTIAMQTAATIDPRRVPVNMPTARTVVATLLTLGLGVIVSVLSESTADSARVDIARAMHDVRSPREAAAERSSGGVHAMDRRELPGEEGAAISDIGTSDRRTADAQPMPSSDADGAGRASTPDRSSGQDPRYSAARAKADSGVEADGGSVGGVTGEGGGHRQSGFASGGRDALPAGYASQGDPRDGAHDALESGRVPDRCRDLVRGYFDLPGEGSR